MYLHSHPQRFFADVILNSSNSYKRCMAFGHVAILLSFMKRVDDCQELIFFLLKLVATML